MNERLPDFFVDHNTIRQRLDKIEPSTYARTRNYLHGAVTYLSPFITHGIIDTRTVTDAVLEKYTGRMAEKLLTEIGWREYFHRVWQARGDKIFTDIRQPQENVESNEIPSAIVNCCTGIDTIDDAVTKLLAHGYMHNHARMWLAAITCNMGRRHWYQPARWLYYHLLDGDMASNSLSWQWICGSFSHRKYYANQDNLNRYTGRSQLGTFLDTDYDQLLSLPVPDTMRQSCTPVYNNLFPASIADPVRADDKQVLLYSIWNLDPTWRNEETGRRILWIQPSMHQQFALSPLRWRFVQHWASQITGLEIFVGEKAELFPDGFEGLSIISREYPAIEHWPLNNKAQRDPRRWCYPQPKESIGSFSKFWKPIRQTSEFFN